MVFTGDGRGKTTAAIGTALRAAGHGLRVLIVFFMKGPDFAHGEVSAMGTAANITLRSFGAPGWAVTGRDNATHKLKAAEAFAYATDQMASGNYDLVVLDEAINATRLGLLPLESVIRLIKTRPARLELILTGRGAPDELVELADLVTEMKSLKHPFERGITARVGIDY